MQYRPIYNLTIQHNYYQDGKSLDFTLIPTPECEKVLKDFRLILKYNPGGLKVLAPVKFIEEVQNGITITKEVAFLDIPETVKFSFWMKMDNPQFASFTDLDTSFEKTISHPVFHNEDLKGSGILNVKELETFQTDRFYIPKDLPANIKVIPFILKNNPAKPLADLQINIGKAGKTAAEILASWNKWNDSNENAKGFSLDTMGNGSDTLTVFSDFEKLQKPYKLELVPGLTVNYHGKNLMPKVRITRGSIDIMPAGHNIKFNPLENPPLFTIYLRSNITNNNYLPPWKDIADMWMDVDGRKAITMNSNNDNKGFQLTWTGSNDTKAELIEDFQDLGIQENPEIMLPTIGVHGLKIKYSGSRPFARIKVMDNSDAPPFMINDELELTGSAGLTIDQFFEAGNSVMIKVGNLRDQFFSLTYPVKASLPWGVIGKIEITRKEGFTDFSKDAPETNLAIQFKSPEFHWKYYVVSEIEFKNPSNPTASKPNQVVIQNKNLEKKDAELPSFYLKEIPPNKQNPISIEYLEVLGSNNNTKMNQVELLRLWEQVNEIEKNLKNNTELNLTDKNRFLLVSKGKIAFKEQYADQLILQLKKTEDSQDFSLEIPLVPPKNDEIQILIIKQPELVGP